MSKNHHNLSRRIPEAIKKEVRNRCGFGCIFCGNLFIDYHHFNPEFKDATEHNPDGITLLCKIHHSQVTDKLIRQQDVIDKNLDPFCKKSGLAKGVLGSNYDKNFTLQIGNIKFTNVENLIEFDNQLILRVLEPEPNSLYPRVLLYLFNSNSELVCVVFDNEIIFVNEEISNDSLVINPNSVDKIKISNRFFLKENPNGIGIEFELDPTNNRILFTKINLSYKDKMLLFDNKELRVKVGAKEFTIPNDDIVVQDSIFGILVKGDNLYFNNNKVIKFTDLEGNTSNLITNIEVKNDTKLTFLASDSIDKSTNQIKIETTAGGPETGLSITFDLPNNLSPVKFQKQERNTLCQCGSGLKFKQCCYFFQKKFNNFILSKHLATAITKISEKVRIHFRFDVSNIKIELKLKNQSAYDLILNTKSFPDLDLLSISIFMVYAIDQGCILLDKKYNDNRDKLIIDLNILLINVYAVNMLKLKNYLPKKYLQEEFFNVKEKIASIKSEKFEGRVTENMFHLVNLLLRLDYDLDFISYEEKQEIYAKFKDDFPISHKMYLDFTNIFNKFDVYSANGVNEILFNIIYYLNRKTDNSFEKYLE